jgi:hypothetical protein
MAGKGKMPGALEILMLSVPARRHRKKSYERGESVDYIVGREREREREREPVGKGLSDLGLIAIVHY